MYMMCACLKSKPDTRRHHSRERPSRALGGIYRAGTQQPLARERDLPWSVSGLSISILFYYHHPGLFSFHFFV